MFLPLSRSPSVPLNMVRRRHGIRAEAVCLHGEGYNLTEIADRRQCGYAVVQLATATWCVKVAPYDFGNRVTENDPPETHLKSITSDTPKSSHDDLPLCIHFVPSCSSTYQN